MTIVTGTGIYPLGPETRVAIAALNGTTATLILMGPDGEQEIDVTAGQVLSNSGRSWIVHAIHDDPQRSIELIPLP